MLMQACVVCLLCSPAQRASGEATQVALACRTHLELHILHFLLGAKDGAAHD